MHVEVRQSGNVVVVQLSGKLTAGLGDEILRESVAALLGDGWPRLLIDMSAVSFMDSAGLGELVSGLRAARAAGGDLKLLNASQRVQSTLYMSRLMPIFEIHADEADAVASFTQTPPQTR